MQKKSHISDACNAFCSISSISKDLEKRTTFLCLFFDLFVPCDSVEAKLFFVRILGKEDTKKDGCD